MKPLKIQYMKPLLLLITFLLVITIMSTNVLGDLSDSIKNSFSMANDFFTGGINNYSRIIDFILFFIIFTTVYLIGLKIAFKDKGVNRQISALAVSLGLMTTLALMFGGKLFGRDVTITIASLFPYAIWFLAFVGFALLYWLLHLLMGKKHPILAFILALLITGLLALLLLGLSGKLGLDGEGLKFSIDKQKKKTTAEKKIPQKPPLKGYFAIQKSDIFADEKGTLLTDQTSEINKIQNYAKDCKVHIETSASKEWKSTEGKPNAEENAKLLNIDLAKRRCLYIMGLTKNYDNKEDCNGDYKVGSSESPSERYYLIKCVGTIEDGKGADDGEECKALTEPNIVQIFRSFYENTKKELSGEGKSKLKSLEEKYNICKKEYLSSPPESQGRFYEIAFEYKSALVREWFKINEYDKAYAEIKLAGIDIEPEGVKKEEVDKSDGVDVSKSPKGKELIQLWYDELISGKFREKDEQINKMPPPDKYTLMIKVDGKRKEYIDKRSRMTLVKFEELPQIK